MIGLTSGIAYLPTKHHRWVCKSCESTFANGKQALYHFVDCRGQK
jgi:hypothetical protein